MHSLSLAGQLVPWNALRCGQHSPLWQSGCVPLSWPSSSTCLHVCVHSDLQHPSPSSARPSSAQASLHTASSRSCVTRARQNYVEPRPGKHQDCPTAPAGWVTDSGKHSPSSATAACGPVQPLRRPFLRASQPVAQNPSCQPRPGRATKTCSLSSLGVPGGQPEVSKHRTVGIDAPRCLSHVLLPLLLALSVFVR